MAISGNDRATTPARAGIAIAAQSRFAWTPRDVDTVTGKYIWGNEDGMESQVTATVWTEEVR